ncbi:MAG: Cu-processing system ATP-binding protein [Cyclobacteriaceae bacterium]|jgi:Cu-processing system ATP-binding protein
MITVNEIYKKFGKLTVLDGVSFSIETGGVYAVLGPNGSGKTTMLKTILGLVLPEKGTVEINGTSILSAWEYRKNIAYLPQVPRFPENLTVRELVQMIADIRHTNGRSEELIVRFGLSDFLGKQLGDLSGGTRQKVNIVLAFMFDASICILDEPTAGLDPMSLIELKKLIEEEKEKGKIILITTHIMSLVEELAQEIIFLLDGKIQFNGSIEVLKNQTNRSKIEEAIAALIKP